VKVVPGITSTVPAPVLDSRFTIHAEHPAYAAKIIRSILTGADRDVVEDAALLTSELVAQAMLHAGTDPQLFVDTREGHLYVEVRDADAGTRPLDRVRLHGWALLLLHALARSWGAESRSDGRVVWFDLSL
jgi:hypothetical protein